MKKDKVPPADKHLKEPEGIHLTPKAMAAVQDLLLDHVTLLDFQNAVQKHQLDKRDAKTLLRLIGLGD